MLDGLLREPALRGKAAGVLGLRWRPLNKARLTLAEMVPVFEGVRLWPKAQGTRGRHGCCGHAAAAANRSELSGASGSFYAAVLLSMGRSPSGLRLGRGRWFSVPLYLHFILLRSPVSSCSTYIFTWTLTALHSFPVGSEGGTSVNGMDSMHYSTLQASQGWHWARQLHVGLRGAGFRATEVETSGRWAIRCATWKQPWIPCLDILANRPWPKYGMAGGFRIRPDIYFRGHIGIGPASSHCCQSVYEGVFPSLLVPVYTGHGLLRRNIGDREHSIFVIHFSQGDHWLPSSKDFGDDGLRTCRQSSA